MLLLYALCAVGAAFSLFQSMAVNHYAAGVILVFCSIAWIGIQNLGYAEFDQARRMVMGGGFRTALNSQLILRAFQESLAAATTTEERWAVLQEACKRLGFVDVRWRVEGSEYHEAVWETNESASWSIRIPLGGEDYINFTRVANMDDSSVNFGALIEIVRKILSVPPTPDVAAVPALKKPVQFLPGTKLPIKTAEAHDSA